MNIRPRNRIFAALLIVIVLAGLSTAIVSADHLGKAHAISYRNAMVMMGEYDLHTPVTSHSAMVIMGEYDRQPVPISYHEAMGIMGEYDQPVTYINTLIH